MIQSTRHDTVLQCKMHPHHQQSLGCRRTSNVLDHVPLRPLYPRATPGMRQSVYRTLDSARSAMVDKHSHDRMHHARVHGLDLKEKSRGKEEVRHFPARVFPPHGGMLSLRDADWNFMREPFISCTAFKQKLCSCKEPTLRPTQNG